MIQGKRYKTNTSVYEIITRSKNIRQDHFKILKILNVPIKNKINSLIISSYIEKSQNMTIK